MNKEELIIYLKNKRETLLGIKFRNIIHPILLKIMEKMLEEISNKISENANLQI